MSLHTKITSLFNPTHFQGWGKEKKYFEGWYYKIISKDEKHAFAFIPGIAMDENGAGHSFIQILDGKKRKATYHKFDKKAFSPSTAEFNVNIGNNQFTTNTLSLDLSEVKGKLTFNNQYSWPNSWYSPGIMGPFSFVPFMQCYHGIVSMNHDIAGTLTIDNETIDFTEGRGYMEKDWGRSFPSAYIWMQSNHFSAEGISIKSSVANIPWLGTSFVGSIAGVLIGDRLIQFTTYNFTKLRKVYADNDKVEIIMENNKHRLNILAHRDKATSLASPLQGFMDGRIEESMTSRIEVQLYDKKNQSLLLDDTGHNAGLEVAGNLPEILIG